MNANPSPQTQAGSLFTMQIISLALMAGVGTFGIVAVAIAAGRPAEGSMLSVVAVGFAVVSVVARFLVPALIVRGSASSSSGRRSSPERSLVTMFQTKLIIEMALLEGAAFFALVAYMLERQLWLLTVPAVLLLLMALNFPTSTRLDRWLAEQEQLGEFDQQVDQ